MVAINVIKILICMVFLIAINITDIKEYKIKNKIVLPMIVIGLAIGLIGNTITDSIMGMLLPLVLFPLFALKMLGAGDIKALCAIGAVVGLKASVMTLILTFLSGGLIALGFMICRSNFLNRMRYLWGYIKLCFLTKRLQRYDFGGGQNGHFRFAYAIALGTVLMFVNEYLHII